MAKFILLVCLCVLFAAGNALELTKLCSDRVYQNKTVNAFYQLKLEMRLEPVLVYMLGFDHPNYKECEDLLGSIFNEDQSDLSKIIGKFEVVRNESVSSIRPSIILATRPSHKEKVLIELKLIFETLEKNRINMVLI